VQCGSVCGAVWGGVGACVCACSASWRGSVRGTRQNVWQASSACAQSQACRSLTPRRVERCVAGLKCAVGSTGGKCQAVGFEEKAA